MPALLPVETLEAAGCELELRRFVGPAATELFVAARLSGGEADAGAQAAAVYGAIAALLEREGVGFASVVSETVFLRSVGDDLAAVRAARERVAGAEEAGPACCEVEQPPLADGARLEVALHALVGAAAELRRERVVVPGGGPCPCRECAQTHGVRLQLGDETRFQLGAVHGRGDDAEAETIAMFEQAGRLLAAAGLGFHDVVRTWIRVRDIDRDYDALNRGRRAFFAAAGIDTPPASTGIGGGPAATEHGFSLGLVAVRSNAGPVREVMTTPTLNEAPVYGADFVRGLNVAEANKVALHVSGTASVDEAGRTAHPGDFDAQADRMLLNIATLLERQGATVADVASAVTYLKHAEDAPRLRAKLRAAGIDAPNTIVRADVCRPELLCEMELLAVMSRGTA